MTATDRIISRDRSAISLARAMREQAAALTRMADTLQDEVPSMTDVAGAANRTMVHLADYAVKYATAAIEDGEETTTVIAARPGRGRGLGFLRERDGTRARVEFADGGSAWCTWWRMLGVDTQEEIDND